MVGITFARRVGPYADTKELEYISSLHQTGRKYLRQDGTINGKDVRHFLRSRHGIQVDLEVVDRAVIQELAGTAPVSPAMKKSEQALTTIAEGDDDSDKGLKTKSSDEDNPDNQEVDEDDEPRMDLCQVLALLLIPFLRGGNPDGEDQETVGKAVDIAMNTIWAELRAHSIHVEESGKDEGVLVTMDFLREIMDMFGEFNLPDEILQEMIDTASGNKNQNPPQFYMTKASFLQAMTADTQLWKTSVDHNMSTHYDDARLARDAKLLLAPEPSDEPVEDPAPRKSSDDKDKNGVTNSALPFEKMYTASNIDNSADTYRSTVWFALVWTSTVWIYMAYISGFNHKIEKIEGCDNEFGCDIALAILNWMTIALSLMCYGFLWIMVANLGNDTAPTDTIRQKLRTSFRLFFAMLLVYFACIHTYFTEVEDTLLNTVKTDDFRGAYIIVLVMGICIMWCQLGRFLSIYVSLPFTKGSQEKKERRTKHAASSKTLKFIQHATMLHVSPDDEKASVSSALHKSSVSESVTELSRKLHSMNSMGKSSSTKNNGMSASKVLLNYSRLQDHEEESGGIIWTWKSLWDGSLLNEEGIYLHGRLLAVNLVQFLIAIFLIGYVVTLLGYVEGLLEPQDDGCSFRVDGILVASQEPSWFEQFGTFVNNATEGWNDLTSDWQAFEASNFTIDNQTLQNVGNLTEVGTGLWEQGEGFYNATLKGFEALFNLNETHFGDLFGSIYEGQVPEWNGTAFSNGALTVCYDLYISNGTDVWINEVTAQNELIESLSLDKWEYTTAFSIGLIFAISAALTIATIFIPSFVSWVLKYRSGFEPSLKGSKLTYLQYRTSPDQTAIIWGSAFWGILASCAFAFMFFGGITFLLVWEWTRLFLKTVIAQYIGIAVTITIKMVVMLFCRHIFYAGGYYRRRPAASNIMNVVLEAWNLGLSIGTVTSRVIKLLVVTCFYIGRIDTPMLAPGANFVAGANLDPSPDAFRKDLLIHEAHRHPFLERLGLLYLMKLFNGKDFGNRAGAYWRILFVLAIFPWMRNYRTCRTTAGLLEELEKESEFFEAEEEEESEAVNGMEGSGRGAGGRLVWDASDSIESLAAKRRMLKKQLKDLNIALSNKLDNSDARHTLENSNLIGRNSIRNLRGHDV